MFCKIYLSSNEIFRLNNVPKSYDELRQTVLRKFQAKISDKFCLKYEDSDKELITLSSDEDLQTAIASAESDREKNLRVRVFPEEPHQNPQINAFQLHQESYSNDNLLEKPSKGRVLFREHTFGKKGAELYDAEEMDLNRFADQIPGQLDRNKKNPSYMHADLSEEPFFSRRDSFFDRSPFYDGLKGFAGIPLTSDQLNILSEILERRMRDKIDQRVTYLVYELTGRLNEDVRNKSQRRYAAYPPPFMSSKSMMPPPSSGPKNFLRTEKSFADVVDPNMCALCRKRIEDVKFACPECPNVNYCSNCDEKAEHPHALLKVMLNKKPRVPPSSDQPIGSSAASNVINKNIPNSLASGSVAAPHKSLSMLDGMHPPPSRNENQIGRSETQIISSKEKLQSGNSMLVKQGMTPTPSGEPKKYKVAIVKPPIYDIINVVAGEHYKVEFTIKNNGSEAWPDNIKLVCINGVHKGEEQSLKPLDPGKKHPVVLDLVAPIETGRYLSQWRLQYTEEGVGKPFGSNLFVEIEVTENSNKSNKGTKEVKEVREIKEEPKDEREPAKPHLVIKPEKTDISRQMSEVQEEGKEYAKKQSLSSQKSLESTGISAEERQIMKEKKCSELVLRHAQTIHNLYPNIDIREQIDFVAECPIHLDINDIVMVYTSRFDVPDF